MVILIILGGSCGDGQTDGRAGLASFSERRIVGDTGIENLRKKEQHGAKKKKMRHACSLFSCPNESAPPPHGPPSGRHDLAERAAFTNTTFTDGPSRFYWISIHAIHAVNALKDSRIGQPRGPVQSSTSMAGISGSVMYEARVIPHTKTTHTMTPKNSPSTTMMIHRASLVVACAMMMASAFPSSDGARCASVVVACALLSPPSPSRPPRHASCRPRRSRIDDDAARCRRRVRCDSSASSMTTTTTTVLRYRYLQDDADYDVVDVANDDDDDDERNGNDDGAGGDASSSSREGGGGTTRRRRSLRSVLDDERRTMRKTSSIIELHSIEEYRGHVLGELDNDVDDVVRVIRFSAPWCRTCRSTNVAWERMASKVHIASGGRVKFYSVSIDGGVSGSGGGGGGGRGEKEEEEEEEEGVTEEDGRNEPSSSPINALREMLGITRVPVGMVHHPSMGMFGRIINLDRASLGILRRTLEGYVLDGRTGGLDLDGPKKCGGDGGRGGNDDGGGGGGGDIAP
jgi:hypothetical protein